MRILGCLLVSVLLLSRGALAQPVVPLDEAALAAARVEGYAAVAGSYAQAWQGDVALSEFRMSRLEGGVSLGLGAGTRISLATEGVRSAGPHSDFGVDGDSLLWRVRRAALDGTWAVRAVRVRAALGLVADPWLAALERQNPLRAFGPLASQRLLGWSHSDLGATVEVGWGGLAGALMVSNGEGVQFPERNAAKHVALQASARLWQARLCDAPASLRLHVVGRQGRVGPGAAREGQIGGALVLHATPATAGASFVAYRGRGEHPTQAGWLAQAWGDVRLWHRLRAAGEMTWLAVRDDTLAQAGHESVGLGALGWELDAHTMVWLAVQRQRRVGVADDLAGLGAMPRTSVMLTVAGYLQR